MKSFERRKPSLWRAAERAGLGFIRPVHFHERSYPLPSMAAIVLMLLGGVAGVLGALLGVGGGVVLVPVLTLGFKVPLEEAVPASLFCVVASSCGAAASYMERRLSDLRLALTLEVATVTGALLGGLVAARLPPPVTAAVFGTFLLCVSAQLWLARPPVVETERRYVVSNYPMGMAGSVVAGGLSALLGVGGGPLKVPLMSLGMGVPFKVATATSNLMIGVTGAASVAGYAMRGHLRLSLVAPLVVGVLSGATLGSRVMARAPSGLLRRLFAGLLLLVSAEMLWKGGTALWGHF